MAGFESGWSKASGVVRNHYGPRAINEQMGGESAASGLVKTVEYTLKATDFTSGVFSAYVKNGTGVGGMDDFIPKNAVAVACRANVTTAFSGDSVSVLDVGLEQSNGTDIDADGLVAGASASASTAGWVTGAGALIGKTIGTADGYLVVSLFAADGTTAAAATAGEVTVYVDYILPNSDNSGRYTAGGTKA